MGPQQQPLALLCTGAAAQEVVPTFPVPSEMRPAAAEAHLAHSAQARRGQLGRLSLKTLLVAAGANLALDAAWANPAHPSDRLAVGAAGANLAPPSELTLRTLLAQLAPLALLGSAWAQLALGSAWAHLALGIHEAEKG